MADATPTIDSATSDEKGTKDAYIVSAEDTRNMQEVQTLLQNMQDKFQTMSDQIINRIDEMSNRVEDLEKNISELMTQAGVEPEK